MRISFFGLLVGVLAFPDASQSEEPKDPKAKPANRLAKESSPYLLQHAHNPLDWYPWGEEAFAKAKKEGKLVFLSIGYSSCHWCHVMEKESFAKPDVAKLMNQWFVCIKVDREERPDIDQIYMTALTVRSRGRGGWPLSMFLTAEGKPIWGGTYWPPDDKEIDGETIRGFKSILKLLHDFYAEKPKEILTDADKLAEATNDALVGLNRGIALIDLNRDLVTGIVDELKSEFDKAHGGFGSAAKQFRGTKFPTTPFLRLLQHEAARTKSAELQDMVKITLDKMAQGGIYDQLGGGFHRYSTERTWTVPHFEKMLYDNAQLVEAYADAYLRTKNAADRRVIEETLAFIQREMTDKDGGFYSALDADSEGEEGKFYAWTNKELDDTLGDKAAVTLVKQVYGSDGTPNFEGKYFILRLAKPLAETAKDMKLTEQELQARLQPLTKKLFDARAKRPRPFLDTKVLTAWNGQMIAACAMAGQTLENKEYVQRAARAADFILQKSRTKDGRLLRTYGARPGEAGASRLNAYLDDYAFLVHGLLSLHDATGDKKWLDESRTLTDKMLEFHADKERGGFFYTSSDHEKLFARAKDQYDGAQPSGNSMAARNLVRLWMKTGDEKYRTLAEKTFKGFSLQLKNNPTSLTMMAEALALYLDAKEKPANPNQPKEEGEAKNDPFRGDNRIPDISDKAAAPPAATWQDRVRSLVKISAKADKPDNEGVRLVKVTVKIDKGWYLLANPSGIEELEGAELKIKVTGLAKPEDAVISYPKGKLVRDKIVGDYRIYEGEVEVSARVRRAKSDSAPLEVEARVRLMRDAGPCFLPLMIRAKVE